MDLLLSIIIIAASILLILVVYVQNPKGGGLSSDFGSPAQLGGVQKTNELIDKMTWGLAATIVAVSLLMTIRQPKAPKQAAPQQTQQSQGKGQAPAPGKK